jgi:hypothetical protein
MLLASLSSARPVTRRATLCMSLHNGMSVSFALREYLARYIAVPSTSVCAETSIPTGGKWMPCAEAFAVSRQPRTRPPNAATFADAATARSDELVAKFSNHHRHALRPGCVKMAAIKLRLPLPARSSRRLFSGTLRQISNSFPMASRLQFVGRFCLAHLA